MYSQVRCALISEILGGRSKRYHIDITYTAGRKSVFCDQPFAIYMCLCIQVCIMCVGVYACVSILT